MHDVMRCDAGLDAAHATTTTRCSCGAWSITLIGAWAVTSGLAMLGGCAPRQIDRAGVEPHPLPAAARASLVFDGVTVIDVEHGRRLPAQRVVLSGNRIQAMGPVAAVPLPSGAPVVDARNKYLIPGLWDWHVHPMARPDVVYPFLLANGVTGFRDASTIGLDSARQWRREIMAGTRVGPPRQILSSPSLYGVAKSEIVNGRCSLPPCLADVARAQVVADSFKAAGADMLKMYRFHSKAQYFWLAAAARRAGIPFGGHVTALGLMPLEASDSGASIIDHGADALNIPGSMAPCMTDTMPAVTCGALAARFRRNGTWWVPTLFLMNQLKSVFQVPGGAVTDTVVKHFDTFLSQNIRNADSMRVFRPPLDSVSVAAVQAAARANTGGTMRWTAAGGLPLLAGTDAAMEVGFSFRIPVGYALHVELALLVVEGLTPLQALQAATLNSARFLRATDSLGTVAAGKLADLVLLDGDPLADITNTQRIRAVVANGRYYDRAALDAQLLGARRAYLAWFNNQRAWSSVYLPGGGLPGNINDPKYKSEP